MFYLFIIIHDLKWKGLYPWKLLICFVDMTTFFLSNLIMLPLLDRYLWRLSDRAKKKKKVSDQSNHKVDINIIVGVKCAK